MLVGIIGLIMIDVCFVGHYLIKGLRCKKQGVAPKEVSKMMVEK